jgi:hypothetical protein
MGRGSTPGYVKLLPPPRQSRGNSHFGSVPSKSSALRCELGSAQRDAACAGLQDGHMKEVKEATS